jgi:hypothetical protein
MASLLMSSRAWAVTLVAVAGSVLLLGVLCPTMTVIWDGGWDQEEYRFTFKDRRGRPVEGVRLRVENAAGTNFYHFPVADYMPGQVPASGPDGVLVFHHAPDNMVSGRDSLLLGVVPVRKVPGPAYVCRFLLGGVEVHRVRYNDLVNTSRVMVRRRWRWLTWPELQEKVFQGVKWDATLPNRERLFDLDGDGELDREERWAAGAAYEAQDRALEIMAGRKPAEEELEFGLVEREVVLDLP